MKRRNIKNKLRQVIDAFADSIVDSELSKDVKSGCLVTGGAIANMLIDEEVNDYDLYFKDRDLVIRVAEYYCEESRKGKSAKMYVLHKDVPEVRSILNSDISYIKNIVDNQLVDSDGNEVTADYDTSFSDINLGNTDIPKSIFGESLCFRIISNIYDTFKNDEDRVKVYSFGSYGNTNPDKIDSQEVDDEEEGKYEIKFISANAITLSDKIQLIVRFFGEADEIHENFDYVHATGVWDSKTGELTTTTEQLEALINKCLIYKGSLYPLASIFRARKFIYRGWTIDAGQYLKMAFQLNDLDLLDPYILEEQLTGVDLLYFYQIISDLKFKKLKDENFKPTTEYFIKVIEKVFE